MTTLSSLTRSRFVWDWLLCGILTIVWITLETLVEPNHRLFRLDNTAISYPLQIERVPTGMLFLIVLAFPGAVAASFCLFQKNVRRNAVSGALGFFVSFSATLTFVAMAKNLLGNERPDFLDRCLPQNGTPTDTYVGIEVCTQTDWRILQEGFRSTPSGHSAAAFNCMVYLCLWLCDNIRSFYTLNPLCAILPSTVPIMIAFYVALSRISDYRHHWYDVFLGSIIGTIFAYNIYIYYNRPRSYPSKRVPDEDSIENSIENIAIDMP